MIFEWMLIERKFLSIYKDYFLFNYLSKLPFFRKKSYSKECTKTALFERTAFERKNWISKERYSINRPRPTNSPGKEEKTYFIDPYNNSSFIYYYLTTYIQLSLTFIKHAELY